MHPQRWGDPASAAALPDSARGLIELAFGLAETPAATSVTVPPSALSDELLDSLRGVLGAEHVLTDDETRRLRTRGKSTPDLLRARAGDLSDAPDAVVRPGSHDDVAAVLAWAVEHHVAVVPFGGGTCVTGGLAARRDGFAGLVSLDLVRMKRLVAVDHESMTAVLEPGLRGPEAEALLAEEGLVLGHYPQSFEFATIGGFAATRSSGQSSAGYGRFDALVVGPARGHAARRAPARLRPGERRRPGPAPAVPRLRGRLRRDHRGDGPGPPAARGEGLRGLALGVVRGRRRRDADPGPGRAAADACSGSPTRPRPRSTWPAPTRSAASRPAAA